VDHFRQLGFHWIALDLAGFQSGSLNRVLDQATPKSRNTE
jgi:PP-loop superfamily ATP-utilizing enzyme